MTDNDVLTDDQRSRSAACYDAARMVLGEDPMPDDIIKIADYIITGHRVPDVRVLPDSDLVERVVQQIGKTAHATLTAPDAMRDGGCQP